MSKWSDVEHEQCTGMTQVSFFLNGRDESCIRLDTALWVSSPFWTSSWRILTCVIPFISSMFSSGSPAEGMHRSVQLIPSVPTFSRRLPQVYEHHDPESRRGRRSHDSCERRATFNVKGSKTAAYVKERAEDGMVYPLSWGLLA